MVEGNVIRRDMRDDPRNRPRIDDGLDRELEQALGFRPFGGEW
jgi:hypothetical protein